MLISLHEANLAIEAARRHAESLGVAVAIAVVDDGGLLIALSRMDRAAHLSSQIAEAKGVGAAVLQLDGSDLAGLYKTLPGVFAAINRLARVPLFPGPGSIAIRRGGECVGAIGVSGASAEQDFACAQAGIRAIT